MSHFCIRAWVSKSVSVSIPRQILTDLKFFFVFFDVLTKKFAIKWWLKIPQQTWNEWNFNVRKFACKWVLGRSYKTVLCWVIVLGCDHIFKNLCHRTLVATHTCTAWDMFQYRDIMLSRHEVTLLIVKCVFKSGTDLLSLLILFLLGWPSSKNLRLYYFKSEWDEICQKYSSSEYTSIIRVKSFTLTSHFQDGGHSIISHRQVLHRCV